MNDYIIRATAANEFVRAFAVTSRGVTEEARRRHGLSPVATAALGRTMAAALMMGIDLKNDKDLLTIQFVCDGPIGGITVTANAKGEVKGYVRNPDVALPPNEKGKLDVGGAVGSGQLRIMKDIGLKEPYAGNVDIQTGEIAEDISYYFTVSDQIPSAVALGVLVDPREGYVRESGGFILQLMPFCPDEIAEKLEAKCAVSPSVTTMLRNGMTPEDILEQLLGDMDLHIHEKKEVAFRCDCSRIRVEKALIAMGIRELTALADEGKPVTLNCGFCNTNYTFSAEELRELLRAMRARKTGRKGEPDKE